MSRTCNYMVDSDDGSNCQSPYHNPKQCDTCRREEAEAEAKENSMRGKRKRIQFSEKQLAFSTREENNNK